MSEARLKPTEAPTAAAEQRADWRWLGRRSGAQLPLAVFAVYWPAMRGQFLWDDFLVVHRNPLVTGEMGPGAIWFRMDFPLTYVVFWLEWLAWGKSPAGLPRSERPAPRDQRAVALARAGDACESRRAWLAAMLFAVHPVCVGSVAWISELKNTLSLPFFLLSLLWYLRVRPRSSDFGLRTSTLLCITSSLSLPSCWRC